MVVCRDIAVMLLLSVVSALSAAACRDSAAPVAAHNAAAVPTYTRDIAPIVFEHCAPCHRPGQSAPFALLDYTSVHARARRIAEVTRSRFMPPWLPAPGYGEFGNERRLTEDQIAVIQRWVGQGAVEGNPSDLPRPRAWTDGWQLGPPDLVVQLPQPYTVPAGTADVFRNFVVPVQIPSTRFVRAIELRPGNPQIVHHAAIGVDRTRTSRRLDDEDPEPGYGGMLSEGLQSPAGHFLGWTPGRVATAPPSDMAWRLERGTDLVLQLHVLPIAQPQTIQPSIGLFFTGAPPTRTPFVLKLGSKTIDIPPGRTDYTATDNYVLPVDVQVLSVYPHAHYLAKEIKAYATLADGTRRWLIWIRNWNFFWQDQYEYAHPVSLPRATIVTMEYTYDNSDMNRRNPHHPPQAVRFGPRSSDEMGDLWLQVLPRDPRDVAVLARDYVERELKKDVASAEMRIRVSPAAATWNDLGVRYLRVRRVDEAVSAFREALRYDQAHVDAHNNLGDALRTTGQTVEAIAELRTAAARRPSDDRIHYNLGNALQAAGRPAEAMRAFERALELNPDLADAHNNLGVLLASEQKLDRAAVHFAEAVAINPDYADAHNNLGLCLASLGRRAEALEHVRRALELNPSHRDARANLAILQQRGGR